LLVRQRLPPTRWCPFALLTGRQLPTSGPHSIALFASLGNWPCCLSPLIHPPQQLFAANKHLTHARHPRTTLAKHHALLYVRGGPEAPWRAVQKIENLSQSSLARISSLLGLARLLERNTCPFSEGLRHPVRLGPYSRRWCRASKSRVSPTPI